MATDFQVAPRQAAVLARICQRLDGIPLAIELAAARLNVLTPEQLVDRLDDAFRVLVGVSRTALPRHQTMRATIEWSYQLLTATERLLLQRLSVFSGGWTLEAAEAVCSGDGLEASAVLAALTALSAKSMVISTLREGQVVRFRLLETVRQYAREKLQEAGEIARVQARHRDYFLSFAENHFPMVEGGEQPFWSPSLTIERDNFRLALEWSFSNLDDVEGAPRLVLATFRGPWLYHETLNWYKRAVAWCQRHAGISKHLIARLLHQASMPVAQDDPETALAWAIRSVELSRQLDPPDQEALMWSLFNLGNMHANANQAEQALVPFGEAEAILQALGPEQHTTQERLKMRAVFAMQRSEFANLLGQYQDAKRYASDSIRLYAEAGTPLSATFAWVEAGKACVNLDEFDQARDHLLQALHLVAQESGASYMRYNITSYAMRWLALIDLRQGKLEAALGYCQASIRQAVKIPDYNIIASDLGLLAAVSARQGQPARAARLAGASAAMYARQRRKPWEDSSLDTLFPGWCDDLGQKAILQDFEAGQAMHVDQAVAYGLGED